MDILIHLASGKTIRINDIKDYQGNKYNDYKELAEVISDSDNIIFDDCFINMDYVEMIEEVSP
jgi:hypothetical protein